MLVSDIKDDAKQVLGYCTDATMYSRLTHAIEVMANKGQWDSMTAYMDIVVQSGNVITLPREVEFPIKININTKPSFSRSKLYEFSMSGPGNDMADTANYNWMDKGEVSVMAQPSVPSLIRAVTTNPADNGKQISLFGHDANNIEISDILTLNSGLSPTTANVYKDVSRVTKNTTLGNVQLVDATNNLLSTYLPVETEPFYRRIIISKQAPAVRMLFRRRTYVIGSDSDFIPLQSRMAVLFMLKALEMFRSGAADQIQKGNELEQVALRLAKEEQDSRNAFDIAKNTETPPAIDLNYNNIDSIIVSDIYDDAVNIFGSQSRQATFDRITESIEMLAHKGQWDGQTGYVDIMTSCNNLVTLPRDVETPIAININGDPKMPRNKWFEFHLNGPGSNSQDFYMWDDVGDVITLSPLSIASQFIAQPDLSADDGGTVTIYGYDQNLKWIRTQVGGVWQDGFIVTNDHTGAIPAPSAQVCTRITRITRTATTGFVQLFAYDPVGMSTTQMGYYYPDETEPNYRRIAIPYQGVWVRMRYRKRSRKIVSLTDQLLLRSKLAIVSAMKSIHELMAPKPDFDAVEKFETKAVQYLLDEQSVHNPHETFSIQMSHGNMHTTIL